MGASLTMIDRHYGHLARDGREHAIRLLDARNAPDREPWTPVDAPWTLDRRQAVGNIRRKQLLSRKNEESPLTDSNRRPLPYHLRSAKRDASSASAL
jgi:hypothetical protein